MLVLLYYMKRKIIKQGVNTLTLSLPSDWTKRLNLKPGDEVEVEERGTALNISTEGTPQIEEISVDVSGLLPRLADRFMARSYQKGYDKINIKFDSEDLMVAVQNKVSELIGYEIMDISNNHIEIKAISSQLDIDFDTTLRKGLLLLIDMGQTCQDAYAKGNKKALENIFHKDFDVNRFLYFCLRYLNKSAQRMSFGTSILYYLIESLEDLGDELKVLGALLAKIEKRKENLIEILKKMNEMFRLSYEFFYKPEKQKAVRAFLLHKEIEKLIEKSLRTNNLNEIKALISMDFSTRIIYHLTTMRLDTLKELSNNH